MSGVLPLYGTAALPAVLAAAAVAVRVVVPTEAGRRLSTLTLRAPSVLGRRPVLFVLGASGGALLMGGPVLGLLVLAAGAAALRAWRGRAVRRAAEEEARRAVEACGALAAELSACRSPGEALSVAAELGTGAFGSGCLDAAGAVRLGGDVPAALEAAAAASAVPALLRGLAACWEVCSATGAGLAGAVEQLATAGRAEAERRRAVEAELAGPRATAGLLAVLPLGGLLLAAGLGADPVHQLLHTPLGAACAVLGVGLDLLGLAWTARLVRRAGKD